KNIAVVAAPFLRQLCDDLDFEIKSIQPGNTYGGQGRMWRFAPILGHHLPDFLERRLWVDHENRDVDHVVETTASGRQDGVQVFNSLLYLLFQSLLRQTIFQAADLARDKQKTVGLNCRRVAVSVIKRLASGWKN